MNFVRDSDSVEEDDISPNSKDSLGDMIGMDNLSLCDEMPDDEEIVFTIDEREEKEMTTKLTTKFRGCDLPCWHQREWNHPSLMIIIAPSSSPSGPSDPSDSSGPSDLASFIKTTESFWDVEKIFITYRNSSVKMQLHSESNP